MADKSHRPDPKSPRPGVSDTPQTDPKHRHPQDPRSNPPKKGK